MNRVCDYCWLEIPKNKERKWKLAFCGFECRNKYNFNKSYKLVKCKFCWVEFWLRNREALKEVKIWLACSRYCAAQLKAGYYKWQRNPNFKWWKQDRWYETIFPPKINRIAEHRYVCSLILMMEELPKWYDIHHWDCNRGNNDPENLLLVDKNTHCWIHKQFWIAALKWVREWIISKESLIQSSDDPKFAEKLLNSNIITQKNNREFIWYLKNNVINIDWKEDIHHKWKHLYDLYMKPMTNKIKFKKLSDKGIAPKKWRPDDAAYDLYSTENYTLKPGETKLFKTDIAIDIPDGMFGQIYTRSWMALKWIYTTGGTIDFWYVWNVWIILNNFSSEDYVVFEWDRIAQIVFHTIEKFDLEMEEVDELSDTIRWDTGYGSSGK